MLRIAVPNKGSLSETAAEMLAEAGYAGRRDPKTLHVIDAENDVEFFFLRPRDIATYVASGALDVGITGRDLLLDVQQPAREIEGEARGARGARARGREGRGLACSQPCSLRVRMAPTASERSAIRSSFWRISRS